MAEYLEELPACIYRPLFVKKKSSLEFWAYTGQNDYKPEELVCIAFHNKKSLFRYTKNFEDPIIDFIFINDKAILFLFIKESKVKLKIMDSEKIILNVKKDDNINDKDFISIFSFDLLNYNKDNWRNHKIQFNKKGNKLILLAYGILYVLDYNKEIYNFQLMSKFTYKAVIFTFLLYFNNIIYIFSDSNFLIFDIVKNKILKKISYCDDNEKVYFHGNVCFSKSKKYLAYVCNANSIYIFDTGNFSKKECYNIKCKIKNTIFSLFMRFFESDDDKIKSKPTEYYITGIIPFKEYFLFSKVKNVSLMPATNEPPLIYEETQIFI